MFFFFSWRRQTVGFHFGLSVFSFVITAKYLKIREFSEDYIYNNKTTTNGCSYLILLYHFTK